MKKYIKPEMEVIILKSRASLLAASNERVRSVYNDYSDDEQL